LIEVNPLDRAVATSLHTDGWTGISTLAATYQSGHCKHDSAGFRSGTGGVCLSDLCRGSL